MQATEETPFNRAVAVTAKWWRDGGACRLHYDTQDGYT